MRRRPELTAIFAVVVLVVGQLVAFAHEAAQRHVTCAEHGEQLEAVQLAEAMHACEDAHFVAVDDPGGAHEDCAIARTLRQSSDAPSPWIEPVVSLCESTAERPTLLADRTPPTSLYLIAPKTSPPV